MVGLTTAAGVVGFLSEPDAELQIFALRKLDEDIESLWTEVVDHIGEIEALYEDEKFPERQLAALVAAKVYYNLQEYNESMVFALGAGKLFKIDQNGEFEDTIISKYVDTYIALSAMHNPAAPASTANQPPSNLTTALSTTNGAANTSASLSSPTTPFSQSTLPSRSLLSRQDSSVVFDPSLPGGGNAGIPGAHPSPLTLQRSAQKQLLVIIDQLFEQCYKEGRYQQVIGITVEARELDVLRRTILRADEKEKKELMEYVLEICMGVVQERGLRNELLKLVLDLFNAMPSPDYFQIAKCIVYLNEHTMATEVLRQLVMKEDTKSLAIAYQISFDLYDNSTQGFLKKVREELPKNPEPVVAQENAEADAMDQGNLANSEETDQLLQELNDSAGAPEASKIDSAEKQEPLSEQAQKAFDSIRDILSGTKTIELDLEFLYRNNHTDMAILNKIKDSLEARNSIFHTAVSLANAFMHAGTTNDKFFRDNLEWLGKAVNWSKFTATAALGVIHRGNLSQGQKLLAPYLPRDQNNAGSFYSQGGSLYALGLIYANHETLALGVIRDHFKNTTEEVVQHGGALGLGVAGMATADEDIYGDLKDVLYTDSAINGEAVGIAMGLIMLGTGNIRALEDMIQYAHDTQHEKIVRGLALGMALIMYARQEAADELVNGLLDDPDPILRYGGIQTLAMAYCGTSSNKAVRKLLHVAVSDVSDDVRRIAVMSLGFILFRKPNSVPRMVELLSESYNPHVRYGAAMALGISCAGTGLDEAIDLLEPMIKDPTDFVRQGALIAHSMIMVQQNEVMNPKVGTIRKTLQKAIGDRHEDAMTKFGSAISLGIIDAGGRNCTISLQTQTGNLNMAGVVGMAVFTQYWYWFPLTHFLSLSFTPTSVIGLDQDLEVPSFKFHSATRPSLFDYPPEQEAKTEDAPEKVKTAVLSTTAQARRRAQKKEKLQRAESMDIDQTSETPKTSIANDKMDIDDRKDRSDDAKSETELRQQIKRLEAGIEAEKKAVDELGKAVFEKGNKQLDEILADVSKLADIKDDDPKSKAGKLEVDLAMRKIETRIARERVGYDMENMSRVLPAQLKFISFPDGRYEPVKKPTGGVILLHDTTPTAPKTLMEFKAKKSAFRGVPPAPIPNFGPVRDMRVAGDFEGPPGTGIQGLVNLGRPDAGATETTGAAEAAGVLTAVDEGGEGEEDAEVPREFEYHSDGEGGVEE